MGLNLRYRNLNSAQDFSAFVRHAAEAHGVRRSELHTGDVLLLYTRNSIYRARKLDTAEFAVSGGWFEDNHESEVVTSIVGCTWGGSSVQRDFVASCGMRIEFGNRVLTSTLQKIVRIPYALMN